MTKTYDDVEALTRLLEEKERDLELAAYIGKGLLDDKRRLEDQLGLLEHELESYQDADSVEKTAKEPTTFVELIKKPVTQLKHEIALKTKLLRVYTEGSVTTPGDEDEGCKDIGEYADKEDMLQRKVSALEAENAKLKREFELHELDLESLEDKEKGLVEDCVRQLTEERRHANALQDRIQVLEQLKQNAESNVKHQEEMTSVLSQLVEAQQRVRELSIENETLKLQLETTAKGESDLATELMSVKEQYSILLEAYKEIQEELRRYQKHHHGSSGGSSIHHGQPRWPYGSYTKYIHPDSLASELSSTINSEGYGSADETTASTSTTKLGLPTVGRHPATQDHTLSGSDAHSHSARSKMTASVFSDLDEESSVDCRTPDSEWASFASRFSGSIIKRYRLPDKVKIVKPLEGSVTLKQWRKLANPSLFADLVQEHKKPEGIQIRHVATAPKSPPAVVTTAAADPLEQPMLYFPPPVDTMQGRNMSSTSCIYTFSTSTVMHPTTFTSSALSVQMATGISVPHVPPISTGDPVRASRTTSTSSINPGLAALLNERGIHATLPTVLKERSHEDGKVISSTTATPAPSADATPGIETPNEGSFFSSAFDVDGLVSKLSKLIGGFVSPSVEETRTTETQPSAYETTVTSLAKESSASADELQTAHSGGNTPKQSSQPWVLTHRTAFAKGSTTLLLPSMRMPLSRTPNPIVQLNSMSTTPLSAKRSLTPNSRVEKTASLRSVGSAPASRGEPAAAPRSAGSDPVLSDSTPRSSRNFPKDRLLNPAASGGIIGRCQIPSTDDDLPPLP